MSPPNEEAPDRGSGALQDSAATPTITPQVSGDKPPTQAQRVLAMLLEEDEVCGSRLYAAYIPRFAVHIHRMRKQGYIITKRPCDVHAHDGTGWLYRLEALPYNPRQGFGDA